ncbi:MAG: 50S ribosomal protein L4 [Candidatus Omnitrophica bacterium]|nr:50S ribosomal protein L4 [Candidatus Omnitrophota bacterium]
MKKKEITILNKVPHYGKDGKKEGIFELDKSVFNGNYNSAVIHQAVLMYNANKRSGSASTKVRNEVSGGGKKPWRQKGTGRARVGSTRNPIWRGGGIVFGPHPRSFKYNMPKKVKRSALIHSINSKIHAGEAGVITELSLSEPRTRKFKSIVDKTKLLGTLLFVMDEIENNTYLAARNIKSVSVKLASDLNALDVLLHNNIILTEKAVVGLTKRLGI